MPDNRSRSRSAALLPASMSKPAAAPVSTPAKAVTEVSDMLPVAMLGAVIPAARKPSESGDAILARMGPKVRQYLEDVTELRESRNLTDHAARLKVEANLDEETKNYILPNDDFSDAIRTLGRQRLETRVEENVALESRRKERAERLAITAEEQSFITESQNKALLKYREEQKARRMEERRRNTDGTSAADAQKKEAATNMVLLQLATEFRNTSKRDPNDTELDALRSRANEQVDGDGADKVLGFLETGARTGSAVVGLGDNVLSKYVDVSGNEALQVEIAGAVDSSVMGALSLVEGIAKLISTVQEGDGQRNYTTELAREIAAVAETIAAWVESFISTFLDDEKGIIAKWAGSAPGASIAGMVAGVMRSVMIVADLAEIGRRVAAYINASAAIGEGNPVLEAAINRPMEIDLREGGRKVFDIGVELAKMASYIVETVAPHAGGVTSGVRTVLDVGQFVRKQVVHRLEEHADAMANEASRRLLLDFGRDSAKRRIETDIETAAGILVMKAKEGDENATNILRSYDLRPDEIEKWDAGELERWMVEGHGIEGRERTLMQQWDRAMGQLAKAWAQLPGPDKNNLVNRIIQVKNEVGYKDRADRGNLDYVINNARSIAGLRSSMEKVRAHIVKETANDPAKRQRLIDALLSATELADRDMRREERLKTEAAAKVSPESGQFPHGPEIEAILRRNPKQLVARLRDRAGWTDGDVQYAKTRLKDKGISVDESVSNDGDNSSEVSEESDKLSVGEPVDDSESPTSGTENAGGDD